MSSRPTLHSTYTCDVWLPTLGWKQRHPAFPDFHSTWPAASYRKLRSIYIYTINSTCQDILIDLDPIRFQCIYIYMFSNTQIDYVYPTPMIDQIKSLYTCVPSPFAKFLLPSSLVRAQFWEYIFIFVPNCSLGVNETFQCRSPTKTL